MSDPIRLCRQEGQDKLLSSINSQCHETNVFARNPEILDWQHFRDDQHNFAVANQGTGMNLMPSRAKALHPSLPKERLRHGDDC